VLRYHLIACAMIGAAALSTPAAAAWQKASSAHFVIYADESPEKLRAFATRLEKFDKAVRQVRGMADPKVGDGNRLTVFVVPDIKAVQKLAATMTGLTPNLAGFYTARAEGSIAVVPRRSGETDGSDLEDQATFFHEYAHHLMYSDLSEPAPLWYSEGFAEFMSTAGFPKDGSVMLGKPALGRANSMDDSRTFPLAKMLSGKYDRLSADEWDSLYSRSWLLTHYLTFESTRKGQIQTYLKAFAKGTDSLAAAQAAFGDFTVLDRNLHGYVGRSRISVVKVAAAGLPIGPVAVEPLSAGGGEVLPLWTRLKVGVPKTEQAALWQQVRAVASKYAADPLVQVALAEVEFDANNYAASEAAADRALAANPRSVDGMIFKGRAILEQAAVDEKGKTFAAARSWFSKANKIDSEDPEPLMLYHQAYARDSGQPTANAIAALHYASDLAPQDHGLRMQSAYQYLRDGKLPEARKALVPIAFDPHGQSSAKLALAAIARIDAGDAKGAEQAMTSN
jgi:tetratricopeptide (TPR) repeat protein